MATGKKKVYMDCPVAEAPATASSKEPQQAAQAEQGERAGASAGIVQQRGNKRRLAVVDDSSADVCRQEPILEHKRGEKRAKNAEAVHHSDSVEYMSDDDFV